jgi:hypothetical protein
MKPAARRVGNHGMCSIVIVGLLAIALLASGPVQAWDAATTHAGLTERALAASKFHIVLAEQLGRPLGTYEPLRFDSSTIDPQIGRNLKTRLDALDSAGGYRPSVEGIASASAWVRAGAVLEKTPPERGRHHFFEPRSKSGLEDGPGLSGTMHAARLTFAGGATVRDTATGVVFSLEGMSTLDWLQSPQNDLGLNVFFDGWTLAVSAPTAAQRETALVRGLLALGGVLSVLEDVGQPAFVRNDFRGEFLKFDSGSEFERFVADHFGSVSLPMATAPVKRSDLDSFFVASDGKGLAQITQQRFFSAGTVPTAVHYHVGDDAAELVRAANQSLHLPEPKLTKLTVPEPDHIHYVKRDGLRILAYRRLGNTVQFFLDKAIYADVARRCLPEVAGYAAGMIDYLLRAKVQISMADSKATFAVEGAVGALEKGTTVHVFSESPDGLRKEVAALPLQDGIPASIVIPKGARMVAAFVRGKDSTGVFVATGEIAVP